MPDATAVADLPTADERTTEEKIRDAEAAAEARGVAIAEAQDRGILAPARLGWDPAQVAAIKRTVAADCDDNEFVMFLELCARYNLDPFAKQIYAAKMGGRVSIIVSRDGLLAHAHKQTDFVQMTGDVVHKDDEFKVKWKNGELVDLTHSYNSFADRGEIVGAWAMVERRGHGKTYFAAPFSEYKGTNVWLKNPSAMILKVPETYALRKAYSISGVVGEEEVEYKRATQNLSEVNEPDWGEDELGVELKELVDRANNATTNPQYRPRKVQALLSGADQDAREGLRDELVKFVEEHEDGAEAAAKETVTDAEVVPDDPADKE